MLAAAAIAGLLPGLKVTRGIGTRLKQAGPGGVGLRFGGMWTALIVTQVAVMAIVPLFLFIIQGSPRTRSAGQTRASPESGIFLPPSRWRGTGYRARRATC